MVLTAIVYVQHAFVVTEERSEAGMAGLTGTVAAIIVREPLQKVCDPAKAIVDLSWAILAFHSGTEVRSAFVHLLRLKMRSPTDASGINA